MYYDHLLYVFRVRKARRHHWHRVALVVPIKYNC